MNEKLTRQFFIQLKNCLDHLKRSSLYLPMEERLYYQDIWTELSSDKSMIFITGPRQAGKTTLAGLLSKRFTNSLYFNWDIAKDRIRFLENPFFFTELERKDNSIPLIIFDELHKFKDWKNYLKGISDEYKDQYRFLITGSGRLDQYRKGSDSLAGRYFLFNLWPFSLAELADDPTSMEDFLINPLRIEVRNAERLRSIWRRLEAYSGFPEPYLKAKKNNYQRWSNTYSSQLIREDIQDLTSLKSISDIETLYMMLPSRIANPLSVTSLSQDLKVSFNSVQKWLSTFEAFYLTFTITPWEKNISRAIHKERKLYLLDTPRIHDPAARFENMVALELYRAITSWNNIGFGTFALHYIKNKEQQEVDFLIVNQHRPFLLIEAKLSNTSPSPALKKFQNALKIPAVQLVSDGDRFQILQNGSRQILIAPAYIWLAGLP